MVTIIRGLDQSNLNIVFIFFSCEENGYFRLLLCHFGRMAYFWLQLTLRAQSPYAMLGVKKAEATPNKSMYFILLIWYLIYIWFS